MLADECWPSRKIGFKRYRREEEERHPHAWPWQEPQRPRGLHHGLQLEGADPIERGACPQRHTRNRPRPGAAPAGADADARGQVLAVGTQGCHLRFLRQLLARAHQQFTPY